MGVPFPGDLLGIGGPVHPHDPHPPAAICQNRGDHPHWHPRPRFAGDGDGPTSPIPIGDSGSAPPYQYPQVHG
jgi:hypothetical protein